jgi:hypothetical protein
MAILEPLCKLLIGGKTIPWSDPQDHPLIASEKFAEHKQFVQDLGFDLLVKRAKIGQAKHVRVRPTFAPGWRVMGTLSVWDTQIDDKAINQILAYAGQYKGLGNWRPGSNKPGPFGIFEAKLT